MKFKVGDIVEIEESSSDCQETIGKIGLVLNVKRDMAGVSIAGWERGHDFGGIIKNRSGWWFEEKNLKKIERPVEAFNIFCFLDASDSN